MTQKMPSEIRSAADLASFIRGMHNDLLAHPEQWENRTLPTYLEALSAYVDDYEGACRNCGNPMPPDEFWATMVRVPSTATIYE